MRDAQKEKDDADNPFSYTAFVKSRTTALPPVDLFADVPATPPPPARATAVPVRSSPFST